MSLSTCLLCQNLGGAYLNKGAPDQALSHFQEALQIFEACLQDGHPCIKSVKHAIARCTGASPT